MPPAQVAQVARGERIYAVGDIHGRADLLDAILTKISDDIAKHSDARIPRVIFLGDYIDRGDHSRDVIQTLSDIYGIRQKLNDETGVQFDFLAGNHEIALLDFIADPIKGSAWLEWGGRQTLASFGVATVSGDLTDADLFQMRDALASKVEPHLEFLQNLSRIIVSGETIFVHAGLDPEAPLDAQPDEATLWGRAPSDRKLGMDGYRMVHGHFARSEPVSRPHRLCVDTGAYYSGRLTAARLDDGEYFLQVHAENI